MQPFKLRELLVGGEKVLFTRKMRYICLKENVVSLLKKHWD